MLLKKVMISFSMISILLLAGCKTEKVEELNVKYKDAEISWLYLEYAVDIRSMEAVDEAFSDIFIGKISTLIEFREYNGEEIGTPIPYTLYEIEILSTIKGTTSGSISLILNGGYSESDDLLYLFNSAPLPLEGEIYLFTAQEITTDLNSRHEGANYVIGCLPYEMFILESYDKTKDIEEQDDIVSIMLEPYLDLRD